ncbi:MAG: GNAT family N-acetyltransferase [Niabella sp.]
MMPVFSDNIELHTERVMLRIVKPTDYSCFLQLTQQDELMWEFFSKNLSDAHQLKEWLNEALIAFENNTRLPFTIIDKTTGKIAGSSSIGNISWHDKRLEIGWSWLAPAFRGTGINKNAKYLLMQYAFEEWLFERVEFKTGVYNLRARKGLENIGGIEEGVLRDYSLLWNKKRRTTVFYSVLKDEWPKLKSTIFAQLK